jgi:prepilin-type N-terminal cleavage/methylation domain-containing protein
VDRETGFTLVEVLVALMLGSLVTLMAHAVFTAVIDASARAEAEWQRLHVTANARRLLTKLIGNAVVGPSPAEEFRGQRHELAFCAWDTDRRGRVVRRNVRVALRNGAVVLEGLEYGAVHLAGYSTGLDIDYLSGAGAGAAWLIAWSSSASAPAAIRLRIARHDGSDTLLFRIGERG